MLLTNKLSILLYSKCHLVGDVALELLEFPLSPLLPPHLSVHLVVPALRLCHGPPPGAHPRQTEGGQGGGAKYEF